MEELADTRRDTGAGPHVVACRALVAALVVARRTGRELLSLALRAAGHLGQERRRGDTAEDRDDSTVPGELDRAALASTECETNGQVCVHAVTAVMWGLPFDMSGRP